MNDRKLPIFQWSLSRRERQEFFGLCDRIFDEAYLTNHSVVGEFETQLAGFVGSPFAIATSSGTSALETVLRAVSVRGHKVVVPSNTFIATAAAVRAAGAEPIILDIESESFALCPAALKNCLAQRNDVAAVMLVHIGGLLSAKISEIVEICRAANVALIEDAAHAFGCKFEGRFAGTFGLAGCFSFFLTKVLTTGEGGAVVTESQEFAEQLISVRQFGKSPEDSRVHIREGSNAKLSELQAALGMIEIRRFVQRREKREQLAKRYQENLKGSAWRAVVPVSGVTSSFYKQIVIPPFPREEVRRYLAQRQIALTGGVYEVPLHRQPSMSTFVNHARDHYPECDAFSDCHICPPCYPELTLEDIDYVCDVMLAMRL